MLPEQTWRGFPRHPLSRQPSLGMLLFRDVSEDLRLDLTTAGDDWQRHSVVLWTTSNTVHILQIYVVGLFLEVPSFTAKPHRLASSWRWSKQRSRLSNKSGLPSFPHVFGARISSKLRGLWFLMLSNSANCSEYLLQSAATTSRTSNRRNLVQQTIHLARIYSRINERTTVSMIETGSGIFLIYIIIVAAASSILLFGICLSRLASRIRGRRARRKLDNEEESK
jgi:hypothetical protein